MRIENAENRTKEEIGMKTNFGMWFLVVVIVCAFASMSLRADNMTVHLDYQNANPSVIIQLASADPLDTARVYAGGYNNQVSFPGTIADPNMALPQFPVGTITGQTIQMFCIDIVDFTGSGYSYDTTLVTPDLGPAHVSWSGGINGYPMGLTRAGWLGALTSNYWTDDYLVAGIGNGSTGTSQSIRYGALQVAIWEIVFEGANAGAIPLAWNVTNGDFAITTSDSGVAVRAEANLLLSNTLADVIMHGGSMVTDVGNADQRPIGALISPPYLDPVTGMRVVVPDSYQDMLVKLSHIPEPSGLIMAVFGFVGVILRRKKRV